jgi:hypothetical protein
MEGLVRVVCALTLVALSARAQGPQTPDAPAPVSAPAPSPSPTPPPQLTPDQIRSRERMALISLSTMVQAQQSYAAMNQGLFDSVTCLTQPGQCLPGQKDATPVLDPGYHWLEPRFGYVMRFHPGAAASPDQKSRGASPSSVVAFAVTMTAEAPGRTGGRAFCADSAGRMCFTDGSAPPVKDGRCEPCKKLQ